MGCAVCYVTDASYLFPSLASAISLREGLRGRAADIFIFTIGVPRAHLEEIGDHMAALQIRLVDLPRIWAGTYDQSRLAGFHVPDAALGRLFLTSLLPPSYERFLYVDGDTLISGDISPLLDFDVEPGRLAVADDVSSFSPGPLARRHLSELGIDPALGYFNSGVMLTRIEGWNDVAQEAFAYFIRHLDRCLHVDQSALNVVAGRQRQRISLRWNMQTAYEHWHAPWLVSPVVHHFSGSSKPWRGPIWPLGRFLPVYQRLRALVPERLAPASGLSAEARQAASRRNLRKALRANLELPRLAVRLGKIAVYEARASV